jgi:hypothetical protein
MLQWSSFLDCLLMGAEEALRSIACLPYPPSLPPYFSIFRFLALLLLIFDSAYRYDGPSSYRPCHDNRKGALDRRRMPGNAQL